jgi:hypothetical protein
LRKNTWLGVGAAHPWWLLGLVVVGVGCTPHRRPPAARTVARALALPLDRIAIVGASVSAGFGGMPFGEAFTLAAKHSAIESEADVTLFRDPVGNQRTQVDAAIAFKATAIVALDFLLWDVYGAPDQAWRDRALSAGLGELERARAAGAWIVVGDVPRVVTAAEWMLAKDQIPAADALDTLDAKIATWAKGRDRVLFVPFRSWAEPLSAGGDVELAPGERVPASSLVGLDGLHPNALGVWALLDKLDKLIEHELPGTPADALVFVRP